MLWQCVGAGREHGRSGGYSVELFLWMITLEIRSVLGAGGAPCRQTCLSLGYPRLCCNNGLCNRCMLCLQLPSRP